MADRTPTVLGLVADHLAKWFDPKEPGEVEPLGGRVSVLHVLAGSDVSPPPWVGLAGDEDGGTPSCEGCDAFLWLRLAGRFRSDRFPAGRYGEAVPLTDKSKRSIALEVGMARCYPLETTTAEDLKLSRIQWDDSYRIDQALCHALGEAQDKGLIAHAALGAGEPYGPEGLVLVWTQTAQAQFY